MAGKGLLIVFALAIFSMPAFATESGIQAKLDSASAAYENMRYDKAIRLYQECLDEGVEDARLLYNTGNAYFKKGKLGKSILYFEKAYQLDPSDSQIEHNLLVARARIRDRVDPIPLLFVVQWWNDLKTGHSVHELLMVSIALAWILAVAVFVFFGFRNVLVRRIALAGSILFAILFALSVFILADKTEDLHAHRYGIIMPVEVSVSSSPDRSGVDAFIIHEGLKVEIIERQEDKFHIRLADGKEGWLSAEAVALI